MITAFVKLLNTLASHELIDSKFLLNTLLNLENPAQKENAPFLEAVLQLRGRFNELEMSDHIQVLITNNILYKVVNENDKPEYAINYNAYLYHTIIKECENRNITIPSYTMVKFIYENQDKPITLSELNDIYNSLCTLTKNNAALVSLRENGFNCINEKPVLDLLLKLNLVNVVNVPKLGGNERNDEAFLSNLYAPVIGFTYLGLKILSLVRLMKL